MVGKHRSPQPACWQVAVCSVADGRHYRLATKASRRSEHERWMMELLRFCARCKQMWWFPVPTVNNMPAEFLKRACVYKHEADLIWRMRAHTSSLTLYTSCWPSCYWHRSCCSYFGGQLSKLCQQIKSWSKGRGTERQDLNRSVPLISKIRLLPVITMCLGLGQIWHLYNRCLKLQLKKDEAGLSVPAFCFSTHMWYALKSQWGPQQSVSWQNLVPNTAIKGSILQSEKSIPFCAGVNQAMQLWLQA